MGDENREKNPTLHHPANELPVVKVGKMYKLPRRNCRVFLISQRPQLLRQIKYKQVWSGEKLTE